MLKKEYMKFLNLANDLEKARGERTKVQHYTGTRFLRKEYRKKAREFGSKTVIDYINKIKFLLR